MGFIEAVARDLRLRSFQNVMNRGSTDQVSELRVLKVVEIAGVTVVRHFRSFAHGPELPGPVLSACG